MGAYRYDCQINTKQLPCLKTKREVKKVVARKRRHMPILEDDHGGKGNSYMRLTVGWLD